jgi:uncharacterized membrane protein YqhA
MKIIFNSLRFLIILIIALIFISAIFITGLGIVDLWLGISHLWTENQSEHYITTATAIGIMEGVDTLLVAVVLFIFSYGLLVIFFSSKDELLNQLNIPTGLRMKSFLDLKIVLWEAALTTLVIGFLIAVADTELHNQEPGIEILYIPIAIALITASLFLIKKDNKH